MDGFRKLAAERGLAAPDIPEPEPFDADVARGARPRAGSARSSSPAASGPTTRPGCTVPGAFDELGFPIHDEGASTVAPGLYFVGVHFLRKRKSSLLFGVGEDAAIVASRIGSAG